MVEKLKWDHTIIDVNDIDGAIKWFDDLGITFHYGGKHEQWGTSNAVGYFGLNYIELMSVYNPELASHVVRDGATSIYDCIHDLPQQHINTIGFRTNDIQSVHERLLSQNFPVEDIQTGTRMDPKGNLITWKIFFVRNKFFETPYPYVVQWNNPDYIRKENLIKKGLLVDHKRKGITVKQAIYRVSNPEIMAIKWGQFVGISPIRQGQDFVIDFGLKQIVFTSGTRNHITDLVFTNSGDLAGKVLKFGDANLQFE
ncbi:VOC family protein [Companilactobacillus sp.]|jgi:catechol 2,3-dioxygenase-like lactoylglutathione lyase family enzyme|uniref:VOC family protein n=1 Tax=Companilactobacillus sp. TaxID=2767905 RepID=UPI0025C6016D|nr:VOC family protein [Companilactobacillus sp.]MCH4009196.1 VOC family protein [Companilactobacillus sp.]MCH4050625.1 VOC family protein [Companilactobacillus sp.]MCH4077138.1 VOC family protein [Companilactobacillus sp.]MCH4125714.1 VOC family protein [Companilactobacillus sp.]MCI1311423.1 VOC family protein [Companilactobacillus sp.]